MITRATERPESEVRQRPDIRPRIVGLLALGISAWAAARISPASATLVVLATAAAWLLVPMVARLALRLDATVLPGGRAIHDDRMPLMGGLAIYVPVVTYLLAEGSVPSLGLALGCTLMALAGMVDDLRGVSPRFKILMQVAGAFALVATGTGARVLEFPPFGSLETNGFEILFVVAWVVIATNAINLIDGLDGLATSVALVAALACSLLGFATGAALVLAGSALGFLRHNLPRARVFLGDTGSLTLGFLVAAFVLNGAGPVNVPLAFGLLALPLGDAALSAARRWLRGKPIFSADRGHVHHLLLNVWGGGSRRVLLGLVSFVLIHALLITSFPDLWGLLGICLLWLVLITYLLRRGTPRWTSMLLHRRSFRRFHVARRYAHDALRLADSEWEVRAVLERVAEDFRLAGVRLRGLRVERPLNGDSGSVLFDEQIECNGSLASWSAPLRSEDPVLSEERRTILCDLVRHADDRLGELGAPPIEPPRRDHAGFALTPAGVRSNDPGRARVHYVAEDRNRLQRVSVLVRETRRRGLLEPVVVHSGRRDDLGLSEGRMEELGLEVPSVDLDVPPAEGVVHMARVMERYHALLGAGSPAAVVVDDSATGMACALVAKERGITVAHVGGDEPAESPRYNRALMESVADLVFSGNGGDERSRQTTFRLPRQELPAEPGPLHVVPALEALLDEPGESAVGRGR